MQPTTMLPKLTDTTQTILFSEGDGVCSAEVFASDVVVTTNAGNHNHGSSKVKLKNVVDYNWEPKLYTGQLLAIHMSGKYLAYSIKGPNSMNPGTWSGMVRVVYKPEPGTDKRALIKGMKGEVQDLAFAYIQSQVVLACIDEQGNTYVHEILATDSGLRCSLMVMIREDTGIGGPSNRVVWCPYIPDEDDTPDDDVAWLLLTTHANIARMWNMRLVWASGDAAGEGGEGGEARLDASALAGREGVLTTGEHAAPVADAAFSPDGTALATASLDGTVMFFQVYMHNESSPRCLHKWQPHDGKPLSCLFFLDNHKNYNSDVQFWKFAVTGAENNSVIKIWSCKSWNCLQTIAFMPGFDTESFGLKAMLDTSASYLLLSNFKTRSLYVLNMTRDGEDTTAYCKSISEFLLPYPVLSFCIVDAEEEQAKCESSCDDPFHHNGSSGDAGASPDDFDLQHDEEGGEAGRAEGGAAGGAGGAGGEGAGAGAVRVRLRLYIVQPKGLQEGELVYTPAAHAHTHTHTHELDDDVHDSTPTTMTSSILQQQSQQLKNLLMKSQTQPGSLISQRPESPTSILPPLNLMTPDAFSSPGKREEDDPPLSATPEISGKNRSSTTGESASGAAGVDECTGGGGGGAKLTSGGSSPSREVQEIMAHNDDAYYKRMEKESSQTPVVEQTPVAVVENGTATLFPESELFVSPESTAPPTGKLSHTNSETSWPQISMAQITEANQRKAEKCVPPAGVVVHPPHPAHPTLAPHPPHPSHSPHPLHPPLPLLPVLPALPALPAHPSTDDEPRRHDTARLDALEHKIDKLTDLVTAQSRELRALRGELSSPRDLIEETLRAHSLRTTAAVENALASGWERISRMGEAASASAAQAAGKGAARALEPLATALQHELATKLTATDALLRDNIAKLASSKTVMEQLSSAIAASLAGLVRDSFRSALFKSVVPVVEKAQAEIFRQVNVAFQNGTKEFAATTEAAARAAAERGSAGAAAALRAALERHADALTTAAAAASAAGASPATDARQLHAVVKDVTRSVLETELSWWREQARSAVAQMSRAHSPATPAASHSSAVDRQMQLAQIQSLLGAGDVNGAFQLALSASDLALVVGACRGAEPARVFGPPCQLRQHVLLSLVQQLAADMARDTHLKHRYLEEAIMNLDTSNPVTREHLPVVVRELQKQIVSFLNANPGHTLSRQFRMLLMATESLVKTTV